MDVGQARRTLNVGRDATPQQIKSAYRKLVLEYHPDKKAGDEMRFQAITQAYHTLTDGEAPDSPEPADSRKEHDRTRWGAGPRDEVPEEDWSRYTKEFEEDESWWRQYQEKFWNEYDRHIHGRPGGGEQHKAQEPRDQPHLAVDVDQSLCIGCCSCETIAPDVFEINRNARSNPKSTVKDPRGAGVNRIMNAAETCPTKAIRVGNADTGKKMYPL